MSADSKRLPERDDARLSAGRRRGGGVRLAIDTFALPPADGALLGRVTVAIVLVLLFAAAFVRLHLMYSHKFFDVTGNAEWIWPRGELSRELPVAFFATRDFDLPATRYYTKIKIAADPEYTLYFNGRELGGRRLRNPHELDVYDVTQLARDRGNRIVVAVRSVTGVGGLLTSVDLSPETTNAIVTDASWGIISRWSPQLLAKDVGARMPPKIVGQPPIGRWNYLEPQDTSIEQPPGTALLPRSPCEFFGQLPPALQAISRIAPANGGCAFWTEVPELKEVGGVAIASKRTARASAFDFGPTAGRLRLVRTGNARDAEVFEVRLGNTPQEMVELEGGSTPFVFAAGERTLVDPETRHFRFVRFVKRTTPSRPPQDVSFASRLLHSLTGKGLRRNDGTVGETSANPAITAEVLR